MIGDSDVWPRRDSDDETESSEYSVNRSGDEDNVGVECEDTATTTVPSSSTSVLTALGRYTGMGACWWTSGFTHREAWGCNG